jgi:hypothetical protein
MTRPRDDRRLELAARHEAIDRVARKACFTPYVAGFEEDVL